MNNGEGYVTDFQFNGSYSWDYKHIYGNLVFS